MATFLATASGGGGGGGGGGAAASANASLATTPATTPTTLTMTTSATTAKRLGYTSPSTSVICEEVFDDACPPSTEEIHDYAILIGVEPTKEPHLLYLAKEGLMAALPSEWKICYSEEKSGHYYHNTRTKQSQWDHPLDAVYRDLVEQTRNKAITTGGASGGGGVNGGGVATPIIDNSDDVSQLDSGIRSMQGTDDLLDMDMSSPLTTATTTTNNGKSLPTSNNGTNGMSVFPGPTANGFSGGVSRFLESRSKNFGPIFQPVKNTRFEVAKTNAQISLAMKFAMPSNNLQEHEEQHQRIAAPTAAPATTTAITTGGFQLSGTGAMFLKSRRQQQQQEQQQKISATSQQMSGVKGILRDSSLTDMRRRVERDEAATDNDDKKMVRFNLEETQPIMMNARKLTTAHSPEVSINSDNDNDNDDDDVDVDADGNNEQDNEVGGVDDDDENDNENDEEDDDEEDDDEDDDDEDDGDGDGENIWDDDANDPDAMVGMCSLNPFLSDDGNRPIRVISVPKAQTIQMLKSSQGNCGIMDGTELASGYLDKLKEANASVKPMYEDTDSDSKASSVRSFIINKSEQDSLHASNPFDLDELGRKHSHELEQLHRKLQQHHQQQQQQPQAATSVASVGGGGGGGGDKLGMRSLKMASKLVGLLKQKDNNSSSSMDNQMIDGQLQQFQNEIEAVKREHEQKLKSLRHEYDLRLTSHQHQLDEAFELQLEEYRAQLEQQLQTKRALVVSEHKARMATLQSNHTEILQELERDLRSEEEILRREHATKLAHMRDKLAHELELEKQRLRENGEERLYEKVRCEKRLLEDKYRCLKEKYVRLKTDVKLSLERRNRRREAQAMQHQQQQHQHQPHHHNHNHHSHHHHNTNTNTNTNTTTGSETERSISNKPSIGNSENRSFSSYSEQATATGGGGGGSIGKPMKPPVPPKTHLSGSGASGGAGGGGGSKSTLTPKYIKQLQQLQDENTTSLSQSDTTISNNYSKGRYLPVPSSGSHGGGQHLAAPSPTPPMTSGAGGGGGGGGVIVLSDNGNSDSEAFAVANHENNNNGNGNGNGNKAIATTPRKKLFSRTKSASTSRLNSDNAYGNNKLLQQQHVERPCTPVENLRHQLQKLEDLEDQFPEHTLDTTYHLRYPFTDISNEHASVVGVGSELEFFKHRIHLERDSVRRAKESLRLQRTNFRARQREIKQRHKVAAALTPRHTTSSLDQLIHEEKELTEMEVNLHRTRALLGEKVIRLRHLEQSLLRIYEKEKPNLELEVKAAGDDAATLSDLSSHSSSGFSSTDFASGADLHKRKEYFQQESNECIQSLEILNAEIREILDILGQKQQSSNVLVAMPPPTISSNELSWSHHHMLTQSTTGCVAPSLQASLPPPPMPQLPQLPLPPPPPPAAAAAAALQTSSSTHSISSSAAAAAAVLHAPQSIPTLADRLETYRQLAAGRMHSSMGGAILAANTIVSQSPRAVNYTTSLVERTRDLRNWLRQAKTEHELLAGMGMSVVNVNNVVGMQQHVGLPLHQSNVAVPNVAANVGQSISAGGGVSIGGAIVGTTTNSSTTCAASQQTNL